MGWFDKQIRQRMQSDQNAFEESFFRVAGVVLGGKTAQQMQDSRRIEEEGREEGLK